MRITALFGSAPVAHAVPVSKASPSPSHPITNDIPAIETALATLPSITVAFLIGF